MKTLGLLLVGLLLVSLLVGAGEVITNDTDEDASGLRIAFSTPVLITGFGDALTSVEPHMLSYEFVFSGGIVEPWGSHWMSWAPSTAQIINSEWINQLAVPCVAGLHEASVFGAKPPTEDAISDIIYAYLDAPRFCKSSQPMFIPVYLSVPYITSLDDSFLLSTPNASAPLYRVDEVTLVGEIAVQDLPAIVDINILCNGTVIKEARAAIENGYQAVSLSLSEKELGVADCAPFPSSFHAGAALTDVWGSFLYGARGEGATHHREYFGPTCQRLAEDGFGSVYVTSTFFFEQVDPLPVLEIGNHTMGIEQDDLQFLVGIAHENDLRFVLTYNACPGTDELVYSLTQPTKNSLWIAEFFDEYEKLMLQEAQKAEQSGVDAFVLNWQAGSFRYAISDRDLMYQRWKEVVAVVREVFSGELLFNICNWRTVDDIENALIPDDTFAGIDSFMLSQWMPNVNEYGDSIPYLYQYFSNWLDSLSHVRNALGRPVYLELNIQSTDGYLVDGWSDVAIGILGGINPDFFEQSRACEALFRAIMTTGIGDGVILYKYHWDDPFGPDLEIPSISRMDLSGSIRNKPAEAIVKRWLSGKPGPEILISQSQVSAMNRPWCGLPDPLEFVVSPEPNAHGSTLLIDDFENPSSSANGEWDYGTSEKYYPGTDPDSYCDISLTGSGIAGGYLAAEFFYTNWLKVGLNTSLDASQYDGVEVILWAHIPMRVDIELGICVSPWAAYLVRGIVVSDTPRRFRIPFAEFVHESGADSAGVPEVHLEHICGIGFFANSPGSENTLFIDNLVLYRDDT